MEWTGDYACSSLMSSVYEEMKNKSLLPLTMDLSVMEKKYYKEGGDPIESNTTMLQEQMPERNVRLFFDI